MRKRILLLASLVAALAAIGAFASAQHAAARVVASVASCPTVKAGQLTIGTDNPAYPPWYAGGTHGSKWKINDPSTGKGYESAVAYAIAAKIGYARTKVWCWRRLNRRCTRGPVATPAGHVLLPTHREVVAAAYGCPLVGMPPGCPGSRALAACLHSTPPRVLFDTLHRLWLDSDSCPRGKSRIH